MNVLQVTLSYSSDPDEQITISPTMVYEIDQAYHAGPVDFATLAAILNPTPPSAITNIVVVLNEQSGEVDAEATFGFIVVDLGGAVVAGDATGLANDTTVYTCIVVVDGVENNVEIVGSDAQTFTELLIEVNADLVGAELSLVGGNLVCTSDSVGEVSSIAILDDTVFSSLTDLVEILTATTGTDATYSDTASMNVGDDEVEFNSDFAALEGDLYNILSKGRVPAYTLV